MLLEHRGLAPTVDESAWVAPTAVLCGDVRVGPGSRVLFGAVLTAETGTIEIGRSCVIMEQAVVRASKHAPARIGDHVLIGPHAHLSGCTIEDEAFVATRASVFNNAKVGSRAEVRIGGVLHVNSRLAPDQTIPIGWIGVGNPARLFPPSAHEDIWSIQHALDFPRTVFGVERAVRGESIMPRVMERYASSLGAHEHDRCAD